MAPFRGAERVAVVPPSVDGTGDVEDEAMRQFRNLIEREHFKFEVELGAPVAIVNKRPHSQPAFLIGPRTANPSIAALELPEPRAPTVTFYANNELLIADGPELAGALESLSLLRTRSVNRLDQVTAYECESLEQILDRVQEEIAITYPGFELRGLDWDEICTRYRDTVKGADNMVDQLERWVAELGDMHTSVKLDSQDGLLPYTVHVAENKATFFRVPEWTAAYETGVRPGDTLVEFDVGDFWSKTGAPPHLRGFLTGRRLLSGPVGKSRTFQVRRNDGTEIAFDDIPTYQPWIEPVSWRRVDKQIGYIRVHGFSPGTNLSVDAALEDLNDTHQLIVDLRGNAGGLLVEALDFRDRFVPEPMVMGTIQFSTPRGGLSRHEQIVATPTEIHQRWNRPVRFLIDQLTASASEDALLGLRGLPNVQLMGTRTGGGSGRPRTIRLAPGIRLSISSALTYERSGHCVEGSGIEPDVHHPVTLDENALIEVAARNW